MTSSDVLDTAFAIQLRDATDLLLARLDKVLDVLEVLGLGLQVVPGRGQITSASVGDRPGPRPRSAE